MTKYLEGNVVIPQRARDEKLEGKAFVRFVVSANGEISDVRIAKGVPNCPECDKEALRVVKGMPKWTPGKLKGKLVSSYFNLPIQFKL